MALLACVEAGVEVPASGCEPGAPRGLVEGLCAPDFALPDASGELLAPVLADVDGEFFEVWDPEGRLPTAYVIDRDGVVAWGESGGEAGVEAFEDAILAALQ